MELCQKRGERHQWWEGMGQEAFFLGAVEIRCGKLAGNPPRAGEGGGW